MKEKKKDLDQWVGLLQVEVVEVEVEQSVYHLKEEAQLSEDQVLQLEEERLSDMNQVEIMVNNVIIVIVTQCYRHHFSDVLDTVFVYLCFILIYVQCLTDADV